MRHTGPSMSPFNAWVLLKGLETMSLRVEKLAANAAAVAQRLAAHPRVTRVLYPFLQCHPQHELAKAQMLGGGTVVTFAIDGGREEAFRVMNALTLVDISNNLGDTKSLATHPTTTTHRRLTEEARQAVGHHARDDPHLGRPGGPARPHRRPRRGLCARSEGRSGTTSSARLAPWSMAPLLRHVPSAVGVKCVVPRARSTSCRAAAPDVDFEHTFDRPRG